jgi:hypothetical protein
MEQFIKAHITKIHTKKRESENRIYVYQVGGLGGMFKPAQGTRPCRRLPAVGASGWEEEQVLPLAWEERLHLPHEWMGSRSTGW